MPGHGADFSREPRGVVGPRVAGRLAARRGPRGPHRRRRRPHAPSLAPPLAAIGKFGLDIDRSSALGATFRQSAGFRRCARLSRQDCGAFDNAPTARRWRSGVSVKRPRDRMVFGGWGRSTRLHELDMPRSISSSCCAPISMRVERARAASGDASPGRFGRPRRMSR